MIVLEKLQLASRHDAAAALAWLMDTGMDVAVDATPRDWLSQPVPAVSLAQAPAAQPARSKAATPASAVAEAPSLAGIDTLDALDAAVMAFDHPLNPGDGARHRLFAGSLGAPLLVLAEMPIAPDSDEARLMQAMIAATGLNPDGVAQICLIPWATSGNRPAKPKDVESFTPFAIKALALMKPQIVLAFGQRAAQLADPDAEPATLRGRILRIGTVPTVATFAPSMLLRQPRLKADAWTDLQRLTGLL